MSVGAINTALAGASHILLDGLARILSSSRFKVVASAARLDADSLSLLTGGDLRLLIIGVAVDATETIEQIKLFKERFPNARVATIAHHLDHSQMLALLEAGADACLDEEATTEALLLNLELIVQGGAVLPNGLLAILLGRLRRHSAGKAQGAKTRAPSGRDLILDEKPASVGDQNIEVSLSPQERRILECLVAGDSNKAIARKVSIAEPTVKAHVKIILRKARLRNRTQAAVWALSHGFSASGSIGDEQENMPRARSSGDATDKSAAGRGDATGNVKALNVLPIGIKRTAKPQ
jgi:two-component system, NarL family, nitrate/nitrite response regulator NarL